MLKLLPGCSGTNDGRKRSMFAATYLIGKVCITPKASLTGLTGNFPAAFHWHPGSLRWNHSHRTRPAKKIASGNDMIDGDQALGILKQLDTRQEQVLSELDQLNDRIEKLLADYQAGRQGQPQKSQEEASKKPALHRGKQAA